MPAQLIITPMAEFSLYHAAPPEKRSKDANENLSPGETLCSVAPQQDFVFPGGIPAFEQHRDFQRTADSAIAPLVVLRSRAPTPLRLVCLPMEWIEPDYRLDLSPPDAAALGGDAQQLELLAVLTFPAAGPPTANLLAPIVLNHATGRGVQAIQFDSSYPAIVPLSGTRSVPCS